jgi:hypothetical protein
MLATNPVFESKQRCVAGDATNTYSREWTILRRIDEYPFFSLRWSANADAVLLTLCISPPIEERSIHGAGLIEVGAHEILSNAVTEDIKERSPGEVALQLCPLRVDPCAGFGQSAVLKPAKKIVNGCPVQGFYHLFKM